MGLKETTSIRMENDYHPFRAPHSPTRSRCQSMHLGIPRPASIALSAILMPLGGHLHPQRSFHHCPQPRLYQIAVSRRSATLAHLGRVQIPNRRSYCTLGAMIRRS